MKKWLKKVNVKKWLIASVITLGLLGLIGGAAYQYDKVWSYEMMADEIEETLPGIEVSRIELVDISSEEQPVYYVLVDIYMTEEFEMHGQYIGMVNYLIWTGGFAGSGEGEVLSETIVPLIRKYLPHRANEIYTFFINVCMPDAMGLGLENMIVFQVGYCRISKAEFIQPGDIIITLVFTHLKDAYPDYYGDQTTDDVGE